ncbi:MAG: DNA polymerase III subunit delta' [Nitrospirota bacterium]
MERHTCSFTGIEGHERPLAILKRAWQNDSLAHAYLFSGEEGIGKKTTALALAAAINCLAGNEQGGCGTCPSCRKIMLQGHPDVHVVMPDGDEIKIDQIRQIQSELSLKPFEGRKKILIVDSAESMNQAASNAFLKTLEEPSGDSLIILIAALPQKLLSTIRSRCQEIRFCALSRSVLAQALVQKKGLSKDDAEFLAALVQGSMGRALATECEEERKEREEFDRFWTGLHGCRPAEALAKAESLAKDRERFERLLDIGIERLRDALVFLLTRDKTLLVSSQTNDRRDSGFFLQRILADLELFFSSRKLLDRRVNGQLIAENLFLKLCRE